MAICEPCKELSEKLKDAPPHSALVLTSSSDLGRASYGQAIGTVYHYRCQTCDTQISCDTDKKDRGAGWYVVKEG